MALRTKSGDAVTSMGTATPPLRRIPQKHATHSAELAPHSRTRSPGRIPALSSVELQEKACAQSSAYVSFSRRYPRVCTTATSPAKRAKSSKSVSRFRRGINGLVSMLCPRVDFTSEASVTRRANPYSILNGRLHLNYECTCWAKRGSACARGKATPKGTALILRFFEYNRLQSLFHKRLWGSSVYPYRNSL